MSPSRRDERPPSQPLLRGPMGARGPMTMGMPFEKAKNVRGTAKRLLGYLARERLGLLAAALMTVVASVFSLFGPKLMGAATNTIAEGVARRRAGGAGVDFRLIVHIIIILGGLYIVSAVFTYVQQVIMAGIAQRTALQLRHDIGQKLARLPLRYYDGHRHGEVMSRVANDVDNVSTTLQQSLTQLMAAGIGIFGILIMMLTISPLLTLIGIIVLPVTAFVARAVAIRSKGYFTSQQQAIGELTGHVEEMVAGHHIVKAFGREHASVDKFDAINTRLYESGWKAQFASGLIMPLLGVVNNLGYVAVCVTGGILAARRALAIGDIQAFMQYLRHFSMPIMQTAAIANIMQATIASAERVFELLDESEDVPETRDAAALGVTRGEVTFSDVHFSYGKDRRLIEGMSLAIKPGQVVAIVGPTGAGKTTLVNLLMRFYEIDGGSISVDGVDIRNLPRSALRSKFGMVLQDTWLFSGTIRDNIAFGRDSASDEEVVAASKAAHADHFIRTLPAGYDTVLNEDASNLSLGQKQLLTIARAILADPAMLILDEATSSVDTRTEIQVQRAMQALMQARTCFVVAHRLSTIRDADLILVMNEGRLIEQGKHDDLLQRRGFYAELYESQFAGRPAVAQAG
jgi:ATP-binding cassette, subfamily B, multidrug efflux pump